MASNFGRFAELGRKIVAIGRNYKDHAKELGNAVPETPIIFLKPPSSYIVEGQAIKIPYGCSNLHHEIELGVVIGSKAENIPESEAMKHVVGYVLALDMTARDFQNEAKSKGLPWDLAKGFDTSCPVSQFIGKESIPDPHNVTLKCLVNGEIKQNGSTKDMIFKIPALVSHISKYFTLEPYDVILTGTPSGVGPVKPGDLLEGVLNESLVHFKFPVESKKP